MPVPTDITAGTISISGSTVTGVGTSFVASDIRQGDLFIWIEGGAGQWSPIVQTVTSNTVLTLAEPWTGPTISGARYRLRYQWDSSRVSAQSRQLIEMLDNGNVLALAGLTGPGVPVFDGPHSMTIRPTQDFIQGVRYDVQVDTLADRTAYDGQAAGFSVLVSDVGDGRSAVYSKASNTSGDWTDPAYVTGPVGPLPTLEAGTTTRGPLATDVTPVTGGYELNLTIPTQVARGNYSGATAYLTGDIVQSAGSSWVALQDTTGNAPPSLPTTSNTWWQLLARAGNDGAGTVTTLVGGDGINVDSTDPTTPVVSAVPFTPDDGTNPGTVGGVPAPAAGDAAAGKALLADGTWGSAGADAATLQSYWMPTNLEMSEIAPGPLLIGMAEGNGLFDGFNSLSMVDVAGATNLNTSVAGTLRPTSTGGTVSTVLDVLAQMLNYGTGWVNYNVRQFYRANTLSNSGNQIRLTMRGADVGPGLVVSGMTIGRRNGAGDPYDFISSPLAITVGGSAGFTVAPGATVVSDWITFAFDEAIDHVIAFHTTSGNMQRKEASSPDGLLYTKVGASEISTPDVSGYTLSASTSYGLISKIESRMSATTVNSLSVSSKDVAISEVPDRARFAAIITKGDAILNTDITFGISRNGFDFLTTPVTESYTRADGSVYVDSGLVDISSLASGAIGRYRVQTANGKSPIILAAGVVYGSDT